MNTPQELPLFPLNTVLFPGMTLPLHIFEERYKLMISECWRESRPFGVVLVRSGDDGSIREPIHDVGTTAYIKKVEYLDEGRMNIATLGFNRFRIHGTHLNKPYLTGMIEDYPLENSKNPLEKILSENIAHKLQEYLNIFAKLGNVQLEMDKMPDEPMTLAYMTAIILRTPIADKQQLLAMPDLLSLLHAERKMLNRETHILKVLIEDGPRWRDDPGPFSPN